MLVNVKKESQSQSVQIMPYGEANNQQQANWKIDGDASYKGVSCDDDSSVILT